MGAVTFKDDDDGFHAWLRGNENGYVVNTHRHPKPRYMLLHRATCHTIAELAPAFGPGGATDQYIKVCATKLADLRAWVRRHGRLNGSFSRECSKCKPT